MSDTESGKNTYFHSSTTEIRPAMSLWMVEVMQVFPSHTLFRSGLFELLALLAVLQVAVTALPGDQAGIWQSGDLTPEVR